MNRGFVNPNEDPHRLVSAFEDQAEADGAVRALVRAGLGSAAAHQERVAPTRGALGPAPTSGGADAAARVGLSAGTGAAIGAVIGAVSGLVLVLLFGPDGSGFVAAGTVGGGLVGAILGMVAAGVSAADQVDQPNDGTGFETSDRRRRAEWLVVVDAPDDATVERAASLLAGMGPLRIERYAPGGRRLSA